MVSSDRGNDHRGHHSCTDDDDWIRERMIERDHTDDDDAVLFLPYNAQKMALQRYCNERVRERGL